MEVELVDGVSVVRIDRPPVNALDLGLVDDAVATMGSLEGPIVVTGAGKCFSAGVDLRAIVDGGASTPSASRWPPPLPLRLRLPRAGGRGDQRARHRGRLRRGDGRRRPPDVWVDRPHRGRGRRALPVGRAGDLPLRDGHLGVRRGAGGAQRRRCRPHCSADGSTRWCRPRTCCPRRSRPPVRSAALAAAPMRRRRTNCTGLPARRSTQCGDRPEVCARAGSPTRPSPASPPTWPGSSDCAAADLHAVAVPWPGS